MTNPNLSQEALKLADKLHLSTSRSEHPIIKKLFSMVAKEPGLANEIAKVFKPKEGKAPRPAEIHHV